MILRFALLLAAAPAALVSAQQAPAPAAPRTAQAMPEDEDTITVSTQRLPGQVMGDIKPELTLGTQELRALGAGSITEILAQIAPQTQSGRGRGGGPPAVLLDATHGQERRDRRLIGYANATDFAQRLRGLVTP